MCPSLFCPPCSPRMKRPTCVSHSGAFKPSRIFSFSPLSDCSLTQWEMRLEMIWVRAGFRPLFQNPSTGPFELTNVRGRLIQPLQRRWRPCVTSWLWWPLMRWLHEWKLRGMSSNLSPAERGFQGLWLGGEKIQTGFPAGKWHPTFCHLEDPTERSDKSLQFT